ncbi:CAP1 isoform 11, partial [Pongo abelii]
MADMQNLVERLERAVGRLEAVSHTSDMHRGYGDSPSKAGAAPYVQAYIKEFHTTGLAWSKTGPVAKELSGLPSGPSAGSGPPPPPPGPPPPPVSTSSGSDESASRSALFAQINQGESITHALKHVSDDMKTHKNPALKAQSGPLR